MYKTNSKSPGSLYVGNIEVKVGQYILIKGEDKPRKVTYVMGEAERNTVNVVMKGTGPLPTGEVEWEFTMPVKDAPAPKSEADIKAEIEALQNRLSEMAESVEDEQGEAEQAVAGSNGRDGDQNKQTTTART